MIVIGAISYMKIYLVGGAVRDKLLGLPVKEKDYVVVGATVDQMLKLGYRQVGKEFPVFLHPKTNEEYALARMERKVKPGYQGFEFDTSPHVTLEEDLQRRDLTINAMAEDEQGNLIDPYHGKQDLDNKMLRHVSLSFVEDPVRILRLGRFLARYANLDFEVAPETMALMKKMVANGEVNALVAERVWKELERALTEKNPEKFFAVLDQCGALPILFPSIKIDGAGIQALIKSTSLSSDSVIRFAALMHDVEDKKNIQELCNRYRAPNSHKELATLTAQHYKKALQGDKLSDAELLQLFYSLDIFRRMDRFQDFLLVCEAIGEKSFNKTFLEAAAKQVKSVDARVQEFIAAGFVNQALAEHLKQMRGEELRNFRLKNS